MIEPFDVLAPIPDGRLLQVIPADEAEYMLSHGPSSWVVSYAHLLNTIVAQNGRLSRIRAASDEVILSVGNDALVEAHAKHIADLASDPAPASASGGVS